MFGMEIIDASFLPALIIALFAGLASFLSPCVLPIVPPYLAYMSGVALYDLDNKKGRQKIVFTALFFVLGLSTVFIFLGFSASAIIILGATTSLPEPIPGITTYIKCPS